MESLEPKAFPFNLFLSRSQSFARRSRGCVAEALGERLGPSEERRRCALRDQAKELMQADASRHKEL